jgi:hypothetical protein
MTRSQIASGPRSARSTRLVRAKGFCSPRLRGEFCMDSALTLDARLSLVKASH